MENNLAVYLQVRHTPTLWPSVLLLSIHLGEMKAQVHTNTYTRIVMTSLFLIAKNCWQAKIPSVIQTNCGYPYNELLLFSDRKRWSMNNMNESQNNYAVLKKLDRKNDK